MTKHKSGELRCPATALIQSCWQPLGVRSLNNTFHGQVQTEAFRTVEVNTLGLVVQNFVSFKVSLSPKFVNYIIISTSKANTLLFLMKNLRILCNAKDSHIFSTKITVYL